MQQHKLYIHGEYTESKGSEWIDIVNPSTEEMISQIPKGTEGDVNRAVQAAYDAQKEWEHIPNIERGKLVRAIGDRMEEKRETFIDLLQEEQGKNYELACGEVDLAIDYFRYMSEWARRIEGEIVPSDRKNENIFIYRKPIGVVAGIVPWNFPVFILARKVATALVTGNTLVLKPSQQTPNTAMEFTKIIDSMDIPKGVYNVVTGTGSEIGNALASHPKVHMVSMTGSIPAGTKVMEAAAQNITKVNLELGGKAPAIVTANADLDVAAENITTSRLANNGQACTNAERVYVHERVADQFVSKLRHQFEALSMGNPRADKKADVGPLASIDRLEEVENMVKSAVKAGAKVEIGGERGDVEKGYFYKPTILTNVEHEMEIMQEEIFGPVIPVATFKTLDEAIEKGNDTDYGLSSSVYTEDMNEAMRTINELKFGETFINRENFEAVQGYHAGMRKSGLGGADGKHGVEDFLVTQVAYLQYKEDKK
ncbi:lactaldehyde dehydrogenase / glycolaldehyde dehydrogenase [Halobacillus karajensis]|uniref:Lactaldehyde dehydrogenase n=1 Tax=Halobacillus karajensis TaxID=195088 RepID=A0A059NVY6_9BACI|nr:aldehyde dehydrogenase [Halobacillus karajensis]CDQ18369.1 Lactaldehyde dehydrogenase [Halobacillus karajensis]CDQ23559.1 Lactaldehyde dehydrogenase [Halobacillus karajensis]CDQ27041.1 Lactaldehyde dehydrogenase [Halobacillus karajensis]SEH52431.1 lactaldehyde dehydrogenase / glycolaldehyde dehydrogenase [Halobacillus karajensis]